MSEILNLCNDIPDSVFESGDNILQEGDETIQLVVLKQGEVEVIREKHVIASVSEPGTVFGEISVILRQPHSASVTAVGPVVCKIIDDPDSFLWKHAEVNFHLLRVLAERLVSVSDGLVKMERKSEIHSDAFEFLFRKLQA